ncbi:MAG: hypothetical protein Kow0025_20620 [Thermodesulfovibrionales bacterium]
MEQAIPFRRAALEAIKYRIRVLNWVVLLVVYVILLIVVKFLYEFLDFMPRTSVIAVLSLAASLVFLGLYLANTASRAAIRLIDDYSSKLGVLLETTKSIHEIRYSDVLLENIMDVSLKTTGATAGSVLMADGERLLFKLIKGADGRPPDGVAMPRAEGIAGWVVENGLPLRVDDAARDGRLHPEEEKVTGTKVRSVVCVPLQLRDSVIGALEVVKDRGKFNAEDEELLFYFAGQAAIALERAEFYEDKKNFEIHLTNILIDAMDNAVEKRGHLKRVARYALHMARAMGLPEDETRRLYRASLLHDIGFLKMRLEDIANPDEYRKHPELGYEMLRPVNFYADIAPIVLHHHERYDGRGYPARLQGESIPRESRIIAILEAFDAIASRHSYRHTGRMLARVGGEAAGPRGYHDAVRELRVNAGTQFDPELTRVFLDNISEELAAD